MRFRSALLKLECLRPSGEPEDRALGIFPALSGGSSASLAATAGAAIAAAGWARSRGVRLFVALHGVVTHESRETLRLLGAEFEASASAREARNRVVARSDVRLPALDGEEAAQAIAKTLGPELVRDGVNVPLIVAPAGAGPALLAALRALPGSRGVALVAAGEELPGLPREAKGLPDGVERRPVSRAACADARAELAREAGLLVSHASAQAAFLAVQEGALALVTTGEREFSLEVAA